MAYFNRQTGMNLTPAFDEYLRHAALPALELKFDEPNSAVSYRWKADEPTFAMRVRVGTKDHWQTTRGGMEDHADAPQDRRIPGSDRSLLRPRVQHGDKVG